MLVLQALTEACDLVQERLDAIARDIAHERRNIDQLEASLQTLRRLGQETFKPEEDKS